MAVMRRPLLPAVALAWLALGSGAARAADPPPLTVFAAADLTTTALRRCRALSHDQVP